MAFSDPGFYEVGEIYQALGALYTGETQTECRRRFPGTNRAIHDRTYSQRIKFKPTKNPPRRMLEKVEDLPKLRYVFFLGDKEERKKLKELCKFEFLPYSKRSDFPERFKKDKEGEYLLPSSTTKKQATQQTRLGGF